MNQRKSQSTDRLDAPPLPEKKNRAKVHQISLSPKTSRVHASTPDVSSLKRTNQPVTNVCSEMQQLRMKLRNTANQTVAEIEEKFSPKFNRLKLGPTIDLPLDNASSGSHSHQGSLDSSTSNVPMLRQVQRSSQHSRQHSLPLSVVAQTQPHSTTSVTALSPPKSPPPSNSMGPPSRSPTPPHQLPYGRQSSHGSSNLSSLITTYYQNQPYEVPMSSGSHRPGQQRPNHKHSISQPVLDATSAGLYHKPPPPPVSRRYSPKSQSDVQVGDMHSSEYAYDGRETAAANNHSNLSANRYFASNPNLLSSGTQDSTHYSTAVIKKRRSSGNKNVPSVPQTHTQHSNGNGAVPVGRTYEPQSYDQQGSTGHAQLSSQVRHVGHKPVSRGSNRQYSASGPVKTPTSAQNSVSNSNQGVPVPSSEMNFQQAPRQIRPYMSTGELRASMRQFQYVPFAEQRKIVASGRGRLRQEEHEHTWL